MTDTFLLLTPLLMLAVVALLAFVGCSFTPSFVAAPTGLAAKGCFGKVEEHCDAVGGATKYDLVRLGEANPIYSGASNVFTDTSVTPGNQYSYEVRVTIPPDTSGYSQQVNATPLPGQPFLTFDDQQPGLKPRHDFDDFLGMAITVGARPLTVVALGRWSGLGVNQTHPMHIVDDVTKQVVNGSDVTVDPGTSTSFVCDGFRYTSLSAPVTLNAGSKYYILTKESLNGDNFYDDLQTDGVTPTVVTPTADATINSSIYFSGAFIPHPPGLTYGPVNFAYVYA
jgi:hypothetical protein